MSLFSEYPVIRTVPDFIGLGYDDATELERREGVRLADPDPDAAPISTYWWEHKELVVLTQSPLPGEQIDRRRSVTVTLGPPRAPTAARVGPAVPPALIAEAESSSM